MTALLSVQQVTKVFGGLTAVDSVDLDIAERSISSLIGPNGAGKTTLFNCLTGLHRPESGEILFSGSSLIGLRPDEITDRGVARTYQNIRLFGRMTALENVLVGQHLRLQASHWSAVLRTASQQSEERAAREYALELLEFVDLSGREGVVSTNLPYGDQRLLEVARALGSQPSLLLLDEPAAGMNPSETDRMMELVHRLRDEKGITVFLIEHDMKVVMSISESVAVLDYGEKIAEGTPEEVRANARVVEAYLGPEVAVQEATDDASL
ncbi:MAG: ABC transporter ATP-binding protein [Caldilineaceae bacterium]|nr:ABC transporter ATP-binding protein [Caldilineaceae bacterium]